MKTVTFRPLRRVSKTGKIVVASYMQWRKVKTANYSAFNLIIDGDYKFLPPHERVYDHKGNDLFFFQYNPVDIPVYDHTVLLDISTLHGTQYGLRWNVGGPVNYNVRGMDCDGVPTFSHLTADQIVNAGYKDMNAFEPLTVAMVRYWFGWFLYNLENATIQYISHARNPGL